MSGGDNSDRVLCTGSPSHPAGPTVITSLEHGFHLPAFPCLVRLPGTYCIFWDHPNKVLAVGSLSQDLLPQEHKALRRLFRQKILVSSHFYLCCHRSGHRHSRG